MINRPQECITTVTLLLKKDTCRERGWHGNDDAGGSLTRPIYFDGGCGTRSA